MKVCTKCKEEKELTEFGKDKNRKDGLTIYCKPCKNAKNTIFRKENSEKVRIGIAKHRKQNSEKIKISNAKYREENRIKIRKGAAKRRKNNKGKINANTAKRRSTKLQATLPWLTKEQLKQIRDIYIEAAKRTKETGISHHVDHIIPLQGKNVRGLHVPWNLQILTAKENLSKNNKIS